MRTELSLPSLSLRTPSHFISPSHFLFLRSSTHSLSLSHSLSEVDYKMAVEAHTRQFMGFQANMLEASQKFGSLEQEHLAQMITFVMKMSEVGLVWLHLS